MTGLTLEEEVTVLEEEATDDIAVVELEEDEASPVQTLGEPIHVNPVSSAQSPEQPSPPV